MAALYTIVLFILCCIALLNGSSLWLVACLAATSLLALPAMTRAKLIALDVIFILFILYCSFFALAIKAYVQQPVDQNIFEPGYTGLLLFSGALSAYAGYGLSRLLFPPTRNNTFETHFRDKRFLGFFTLTAGPIGAACHFLHAFFRPIIETGEAGTGFFGQFVFLFLFAAVACAALAAKDRKYLPVLIGFIATALFLALVTNTKRAGLEVAFALAAGMMFLGLRIKISTLLPSVAVSLVSIFYLAPMIQIARSEVAGLSFADRIGIYQRIMDENEYSASRLSERAGQLTEGFAYSFSSYGSFIYPENANLDRFAMILPVDQVVRALDRSHTLGVKIITHDLLKILPSVGGEKDPAATPDLIAWEYGIRGAGSVARPVIGLIASSIAAFGEVGVLVLPAVTFIIIGFVLSLITSTLAGNPWSSAMAALCIFVAEKEISPILSFFARDFIIILVVIYSFILIYGRRFVPT